MTSPLVAPAPPAGKTWTLAWGDEFDDTTGNSGPGNGLVNTKWNIGWQTSPTASPSALGVQNVTSSPVGGSETEYYGPAGVTFPGDGTCHLKMVAPVDSPTHGIAHSEAGMISSANLALMNPLGITAGIPAVRANLTGPQVWEFRVKFSGPSSGADWQVIWTTNGGNCNSQTGWSSTGWQQESDWWEQNGGTSLAGSYNGHYHGGTLGDRGFATVPSSLNGLDLSAGFNTFTMWTDGTNINFYVNGTLGSTVPCVNGTQNVWAQPHYLMLAFQARSNESNPRPDMQVEYVRAFTAQVVSGTPDAPTFVSSAAGDHNIGLIWSVPPQTPITEYTVELNSTSGTSDSTVPGSQQGVTINGLTNGVTYTAKVKAQNSSGYGPYSSPVTLTPAKAGKTWQASTGLSPGTEGSLYTSGEMDADFGKADGSVHGYFTSYGGCARNDVRTSQIQGSGYSRYDAELDRSVKNGATTLVICFTDAGSYAISGGSQPDRTHAAALQTSWATTWDRYRARYPGITLLGEFWNEPNAPGEFTDPSGNFIVGEWAFWLDLWEQAVHGTDSSALLGISGFAPSGNNALGGSNLFQGYGYAGGRITHSPLDALNNGLNDVGGILGANPPINVTKFAWLPWHAYWSSNGPLATHGVQRVDVNTGRVVVWPSMPTKYPQPYNYCSARQIPDAYQLWVNAGGSPQTKVHATESGGSTAPYYNAGTSYAVGDAAFASPGTPITATRQWARQPLRIVYAGPPAAGTPTSNTTYWRNATDSDGYSGNPVSSVQEEDELGYYADRWQRVWFGLDPNQDGVNIGPLTGTLNWYNHRDESSPARSGGDFGLVRKSDGGIKGSASGANGPLQAFRNNRLRPDTRGDVNPPPPPSGGDYDSAGVVNYA